MNLKYPLSNSSSAKTGFQLGLQPAQAWTAILALIFFTVTCIVGGAGKVLYVAFPLGSLAVGALLYFRYPILYIGFTWWMWFLTPLVRRLADYRSSFTEPNPILLAPFLVTLLTFITFWRGFPSSYRQGGFPFILCLSSLVYGYCIAIIQYPLVPVTISFLDWIVPVFLCFHIYSSWRCYPEHVKNIQRTFFWGVLIMGAYGVIQYLILPEWDRFWINNAGMASSGLAQPLQLNIHSTMNDRGTFSVFMMAGLLLMLANNNPLNFPASAFGYLSLLLSRVRTSWAGWLLGLLILSASLKARLQMRLILILVLIAACAVPLTIMDSFSDRIGERFDSFSNIQADDSFQGRQAIYEQTLNKALTSIVGYGIGQGTGDSGFLTTLLQLGWLGTIFYWGGILLMLSNLFQIPEVRNDQIASTARAIAISTFAMLPGGNLMDGPDGVIFWGFLGLGLAANRYYRFNKTI